MNVNAGIAKWNLVLFLFGMSIAKIERLLKNNAGEILKNVTRQQITMKNKVCVRTSGMHNSILIKKKHDIIDCLRIIFVFPSFFFLKIALSLY